MIRKQGITPPPQKNLDFCVVRDMEDSPPTPPALTDEGQTGTTRGSDNERRLLELHIRSNVEKYFKQLNLNERH